jgi:hypothetical protein
MNKKRRLIKCKIHKWALIIMDMELIILAVVSTMATEDIIRAMVSTMVTAATIQATGIITVMGRLHQDRLGEIKGNAQNRSRGYCTSAFLREQNEQND